MPHGGIIYGEEVKTEVLARIVQGHSLRQIAQTEGMPKPSTVCWWVVNDDDFAEQYARAKRAQAQMLADEIFEIADDGRNDTMTDEEGNPQVNWDLLKRSELRVNTRKWYLGKVLPKIYGDKIIQQHEGKDGGPIQFVTKSILEE